MFHNETCVEMKLENFLKWNREVSWATVVKPRPSGVTYDNVLSQMSKNTINVSCRLVLGPKCVKRVWGIFRYFKWSFRVLAHKNVGHRDDKMSANLQNFYCRNNNYFQSALRVISKSCWRVTMEADVHQPHFGNLYIKSMHNILLNYLI